MSVLRATHLAKSYKSRKVITDLSVEVESGQIVGLLGPNGAGKTTAFNAISRLVRPASGRISFAGQDLGHHDAARLSGLGIARTFQNLALWPGMTVLENVMVGAFNRTGLTAAAKRVALDVLEFTGMAARRDTFAAELTPPEKRRLEVARALATQPKLLLLDEVMTGLTPTEAQAGVQLVRDIRTRGITILMVEHVMEIVMPLADRVVVLNLGRVLAEGKPQEIVRNPDVITAYLGEKYRAGAAAAG
jgi:branched-chain amino acid transport system ATP-binding protein